MPHILFLSLTNSSTGNCTTAKRICNYLRQEKFKVKLVGLKSDELPFHTGESFLAFVHEQRFDLVIGLHALHSGKWLRYLEDVPFIIIFGGTDLYQHSMENSAMAIMTAAIKAAKYFVTFSEEMSNCVKSIWPAGACDGNIKIIPQGAFVTPITYPISQKVEELLSDKIPKTNARKLCLWVGGLRPVKDLLFFTKHFSDFHQQQHPHLWLLVVGPILDSIYGQKCETSLKLLPGVVYLGEMAMCETHALMCQSFALINTSISEGMCTAILEVSKAAEKGNLSSILELSDPIALAS